MTPTNKLRFVEREMELDVPLDVAVARNVRVLQQWWEPPYPGSTWEGEWRDVPLEEEK